MQSPKIFDRMMTYMNKEIHPKYFDKSTISCVCGNNLVVGSTIEKISIEICSACHPFYTGKKKIIDTAGRVEKFEARRKVSAERQATMSLRKKAKTPITQKNVPRRIKKSKDSVS